MSKDKPEPVQRCKRCFTPLINMTQEEHSRKGCVNGKEDNPQ